MDQELAHRSGILSDRRSASGSETEVRPEKTGSVQKLRQNRRRQIRGNSTTDRPRRVHHLQRSREDSLRASREVTFVVSEPMNECLCRKQTIYINRPICRRRPPPLRGADRSRRVGNLREPQEASGSFSARPSLSRLPENDEMKVIAPIVWVRCVLSSVTLTPRIVVALCRPSPCATLCSHHADMTLSTDVASSPRPRRQQVDPIPVPTHLSLAALVAMSSRESSARPMAAQSTAAMRVHLCRIRGSNAVLRSVDLRSSLVHRSGSSCRRANCPCPESGSE